MTHAEFATPCSAGPALNLARERPRPGTGLVALKALAVSVLLPDEIGVHVGGLWFSVARMVLFALAPVLVVRLVQRVAAGRYRFVLSDLFVLLTGFWMFLALGEMDGMEAALTHAGPLVLEFCVGYMCARLLLVGHGQAISFTNFLCWAITVVALLGLLDTLTHRLVMHDIMGVLFGHVIQADGGERFGLLRATSTLDHPILFGFTCFIGLMLSMLMQLRGRLLLIGACGLGTLLALSSAPLQGATLGFGLLIYNRITTGFRFRWMAIIGLTAAAVAFLFLAANHPFGVIFDSFTFNTEDDYFRLYEWQMAGVAVGQSPWFGVGWIIPDFYDIPRSIDSIWLLWALNYGIPGSVLLGLSLLGAISLPTNGRGVCLAAPESKLGLTLSIVIFLIVFLGFTVDFFGSAWVLIPILVGVRAHLGELGRLPRMV